MKINNPEVEVPTGIELNDRDVVNSLLSTLKTLVKNYAIAMTEASNDFLYEEYKTIFEKVADLQRETFTVLFRNGWYVLEEADGAKVGEKYNTLAQSFDELDEEPEDEIEEYEEEEESEDEESSSDENTNK